MTKYVALLRGINVGGKALVKMADLKATFEKAGFSNVSTYINSGNVIFESDSLPNTKLLEQTLLTIFTLPIRVVVLSYKEYKKVIDDAPPNWKKTPNLRCYIAFVIPPVTPSDIII